MAKQYGLILPNKNKDHKICPVTTRHSIFNDDSDSDTPDFKPTGLGKGVKKQDKINQKKAVEEDPTVFQYDEIYDEMNEKRTESKLARKDIDKKPKYINKLFASAERRKRENERRIERQVQKEREEEGDIYKDKESFVTSAYKMKLEEMKQLEEQEKREEYLESIGDVRKQGNLDGFYRHFYDQKVNYDEKVDVEVKVEVKLEPESENKEQEKEKSQSEVSASESETKSRGGRKRRSSERDEDSVGKQSRKQLRERKYRVRRKSDETSSDDSNKNDIVVKKEHLPSNLDADSDFSIDSSDSEDEDKKEIASKDKDSKEDTLGESVTGDKKSEISEETETQKIVLSDKPNAEVKIEEIVKKPKINIWKKRTVGDKFDEAVRRYFERKAQREMVISS